MSPALSLASSDCDETDDMCYLLNELVEEDLSLPDCSITNPADSQCQVGNLVISQRWEKDLDDPYEEKVYQVVNVKNIVTGTIETISCKNVVEWGVSCQIAAGIGDPYWENESPLFPAIAVYYDSISNPIIGLTLRSSGNAGYDAKQYLFNIFNGKLTVLDGIYGKWNSATITDESGSLIVEKESRYGITFAAGYQPVSFTAVNRELKINPYEMSVEHMDYKVVLPPRSEVIDKINFFEKVQNNEAATNALGMLWKYYILAMTSGQPDEIRWVRAQMIYLNSSSIFKGGYASNSEIGSINGDIIKRMIEVSTSKASPKKFPHKKVTKQSGFYRFIIVLLLCVVGSIWFLFTAKRYSLKKVKIIHLSLPKSDLIQMNNLSLSHTDNYNEESEKKLKKTVKKEKYDAESKYFYADNKVKIQAIIKPIKELDIPKGICKSYRQNNNIGKLNWKKNGLLSICGYRVGKTNGVEQVIRQVILSDILLYDDLSDLDDQAYAKEWGEPHSRVRYLKLVNTLKSLLRNGQKKDTNGTADYSKAIQDWSTDIKFVEDEFEFKLTSKEWQDIPDIPYEIWNNSKLDDAGKHFNRKL